MTATEPATPTARAARGKQARRRAPRSSHGGWERPPDRPDPIELLEAQAVTRAPELVPIRYGRMAVSPFAFYRGAAAVMASDLAGSPDSGIRVQLCGDAHLANFGGFASPERDLIFDLNDFDETLPGPWEWDLKRLAASVAVAARGRGFPAAVRSEMLQAAVRRYREAMRGFAGMTTLQVWYAHFDESELESQFAARHGRSVSKRRQQTLQRVVERARRKDHERAFAKLVRDADGRPRFASDPPLLVPVDELFPEIEADEMHERMRELIAAYRETLPADRRHLLDRYRYADLARKVVGVGSVGTRAWVVLLLGPGDDPLFLQCKEAQASVLEPYAGASEHANHGQRVVEGQRLVQAASDILLGWLRAEGLDGVMRDYYVRQLWDWKASADLDGMDAVALGAYARICAWTLARAHARSGDPMAIAGYVGRGDALDRAIADFAEGYADRNERDHQALLDAIDSGRVQADTGV